MSSDGAAIAAETISSGSASSSAPGSPSNRVKFLCCHGGRILPRPPDGQLRYTGGETRVISVSKDIRFHELMKKLTYPIDGEMTLKYQVVTEDLDALVSVKTDEDLRHMFDEVSRYELAGAPRLRAFLFPTNPIVMENHITAVDHHALEQRYIDAINGIIRSTNPAIKRHPSMNAVQQHGSFVSSGCSTPRSPDSCAAEAMGNEANYYHSRFSGMHKVHSTPNICSTYYVNHQVSPQYVPHHHHSAYPSPMRSPVPERVTHVRSVGRADGARYQIDSSPPVQYYTPRQNRANMHLHNEECGHFLDRRVVDRTGNFAMSTVSSSPRRGGFGGVKTWGSTMSGDT